MLLLLLFIFSAERTDNVSEETADLTKTILYTIRSQIKVTATSRDDRVKYTCEAHHEALPDPLTATVQIRVLCKFPYYN